MVAVTLNGKEEWGSFNDFVTRAIFLDNLGERMNTLLSNAKIVLAMAGGVGTLHEVTAAIWYAGNVRRIPVALIGSERRICCIPERPEMDLRNPDTTRRLPFGSAIGGRSGFDIKFIHIYARLCRPG